MDMDIWTFQIIFYLFFQTPCGTVRGLRIRIGFRCPKICVKARTTWGCIVGDHPVFEDGRSIGKVKRFFLELNLYFFGFLNFLGFTGIKIIIFEFLFNLLFIFHILKILLKFVIIISLTYCFINYF